MFYEGRGCVAGLPDSVRNASNVPTEAMQLAFANGVIFGDIGNDNLRRTYGCLFGFESDAATAATVIPTEVVWVARVQKFLSAVCLFLLGLGLRNALKLK